MHRIMAPPCGRAHWFLLPFAVLLLSVPAPLRAQATGAIRYERFTLPNGLDVLLAPDHNSQVAAVDVWYDAGSRDEPFAKAGLARLFERLMFAGSANVPPNGHASIVKSVGGHVTAEVDEEAARFGESLPSNWLSLGLWLEAERMRSLTITDSTVGQAKLELLEDLSRRVSEEPYTAAIVDGIGALYDSTTCPSYTHPTIGRVGSIATITPSEARAFFHDRFAPNNARLVVAGDFDPATTRQLIASYFGGIPRGPDAAPVSCGANRGAGPRTRTESDRLIGRIAVGQFYRVPPHDHADTPALELLGVMLSQGSGSRLAMALVRDAQAALGTQGGLLGDRRGPGAFGLFAIAAPDVSSDSLTALLAAQALWAASSQVTEADLQRAKEIYRATAVSGRERPEDVASQLQHSVTFHGTPDAVNTEPGLVMAVSLSDLRRVAKAWLNPDNALTLIVTPEARS
jgi:zinc protease